MLAQSCYCGWGEGCPVCASERIVAVKPPEGGRRRLIRTRHLPPPPDLDGEIELVRRLFVLQRGTVSQST